MSSNQKGFTVVEAIVVVLVLGLLVFTGRYVLDQRRDLEESQTATQEEAPEVNDSSDLEEAEKFLSDTDVDSELDTSELDSSLE